MSRESIVFVLGIAVFLTPFLGLPSDWKEYILIGSGILLILVGYSLSRSSYFRRIDTGKGEYSAESFVESAPVETTDHHSETNV